MAKLKKTLKLTKLYPGLNKGGLGLPISQLSQMALNMTQINTFQLPSGTRRPWGKWRTIYCRGQRPRRLGIYTLLILLQSTRGRRECSRVRDHPHTCPDPAGWMMGWMMRSRLDDEKLLGCFSSCCPQTSRGKKAWV